MEMMTPLEFIFADHPEKAEDGWVIAISCEDVDAGEVKITGEGEIPLLAVADYCLKKAKEYDPLLAAMASGRLMRMVTGLDNWGATVWMHIRERRREHGIPEDHPFLDGRSPRDVFGDAVIDGADDNSK